MQGTVPMDMVDPQSLVENPLRAKARTIPDKEQGRYLMIRDSIIANGIKNPVIVQQSTRMILGGHTRRDIAIELGIQVPVMWVDVDDDEALYMFLEDNLDHAEDEKDIMKIAWQCKELKRLEGCRKQGRPAKTFHDEMFSSGNPSSKLNMSEVTFWRYVSLNKLIPELQQIVSKGKIGVVAGNILSSLSSKAQKKVYESIKDVYFENSYNMTKTEAEGYKQAFEDDDHPNLSSSKSQPGQTSEHVSEEVLEFYGNDDDVDEEDQSGESLVVEAAGFEGQKQDALQVLWSRQGPDILGAVKDVENKSGPVQQERRSRLSATQKETEEKMQSLLSIAGDDARRTFSVTKVKSTIRTHQLAIERAEVDLISELATLEADSFGEIEESLEVIMKSSERLTRKLVLVLEEIQAATKG